MIATLEHIVSLGAEILWRDEFDWTPVPQKVRKTLDGTLVVEMISPHSDGRPVTLFCPWLKRSVIAQLESLRDRETQTPLSLTLSDGRALTVLFRHSDGKPVVVKPVIERPEYLHHDIFDVTLKMFQYGGAIAALDVDENEEPILLQNAVGAEFTREDFIGDSRVIGTADTLTVWTVKVAINEPFDGDAAIMVGDNLVNDRLMSVEDTDLSISGFFERSVGYSYEGTHDIRLFFSGNPTRGKGRIIINFT